MSDHTDQDRSFGQLCSSIREVLQRHDPSNLFELGAPLDEHDSSVHRIIGGIQHAHDPAGVTEVLERELWDWINAAGNDPTRICAAMAPDVWRAWRAFKGGAG